MEREKLTWVLSGEVLKAEDRSRLRYLDSTGKMVSNKEATEKTPKGTVVKDGYTAVRIRHTLAVPTPKTEQGQMLFNRMALGYLNVEVAQTLAVFDGKVEKNLTMDEFKACDKREFVIDLDALAPEFFAKAEKSGEKVRGEKYAEPVEIVYNKIKAAKAGKNQPMALADGTPITKKLIRDTDNATIRSMVAQEEAAAAKAADKYSSL